MKMFKGYAEYYNQSEPITDYEFKAWTKRKAFRKAYRHLTIVCTKYGEVYWMQVWFRGKKIFGNGNKILFKFAKKGVITL